MIGAFGTVYTVFREHGHANGAATRAHARIGRCGRACSLGLSYCGPPSRRTSKEARTARAMSRESRPSAPAASSVAHQQTTATKQATDGKVGRRYDHVDDGGSPRSKDRLLNDLREAHLHGSTQPRCSCAHRPQGPAGTSRAIRRRPLPSNARECALCEADLLCVVHRPCLCPRLPCGSRQLTAVTYGISASS